MLFLPTYYLEANRPYFPPHLVSEPALANLQVIAADLPPASNIAIECRLKADSSSVDLIPQFAQKGGSGKFLVQINTGDPVWSKVGRFCRHWTEPGSGLEQGIREIWLEFDVDGNTIGLPRPSVFIGFQPHRSVAEYQWLSETTVEMFQDTLLTTAFRQHLATCFSSLPAGAHLFSLGVMLSRPYEWARVCVGGLTPHETLPYLQQIGWPGPMNELQRMFEAVSPLVDEFGLALDVGQGVLPKLGLECYLWETSPQKEPRWERLLDCLVGWGQCSPEKKDALLRWPGGHFHGLTPADVRRLRQTEYPLLHNIFTRRISHLKIVLDPGQPPETKAYLELNNIWIPMGAAE
jgi:hypothetical protein